MAVSRLAASQTVAPSLEMKRIGYCGEAVEYNGLIVKAIFNDSEFFAILKGDFNYLNPTLQLCALAGSHYSDRDDPLMATGPISNSMLQTKYSLDIRLATSDELESIKQEIEEGKKFFGETDPSFEDKCIENTKIEIKRRAISSFGTEPFNSSFPSFRGKNVQYIDFYHNSFTLHYTDSSHETIPHSEMPISQGLADYGHLLTKESFTNLRGGYPEFFSKELEQARLFHRKSLKSYLNALVVENKIKQIEVIDDDHERYSTPQYSIAITLITGEVICLDKQIPAPKIVEKYARYLDLPSLKLLEEFLGSQYQSLAVQVVSNLWKELDTVHLHRETLKYGSSLARFHSHLGSITHLSFHYKNGEKRDIDWAKMTLLEAVWYFGIFFDEQSRNDPKVLPLITELEETNPNYAGSKEKASMRKARIGK